MQRRDLKVLKRSWKKLCRESKSWRVSWRKRGKSSQKQHTEKGKVRRINILNPLLDSEREAIFEDTSFISHLVQETLSSWAHPRALSRLFVRGQARRLLP